MEREVAFVLGGGGHAGAAEVGMLDALLEREVRPDLIVGTSVGALHGAMVAVDPSPAAVAKLQQAWQELARLGVLGRSWLDDALGLLRTRTHVRSNAPVRRLAERLIGVRSFEELAVPFQCVAACIERSSEPWFDSGPLVDAILASSAVPGDPAAGRDRRRALHRRRDRQLDPRRPRGRARRRRDLRAPRRAVPHDPTELIDWLYDWWQRIDDWVEEHAAVSASA
jgi:hypothetical protein